MPSLGFMHIPQAPETIQAIPSRKQNHCSKATTVGREITNVFGKAIVRLLISANFHAY